MYRIGRVVLIFIGIYGRGEGELDRRGIREESIGWIHKTHPEGTTAQT